MNSRPSHGPACGCGCRWRPQEQQAPSAVWPARQVTRDTPDVHVLEVWFDGGESTTITSSIELDHPGLISRRF